MRCEEIFANQYQRDPEGVAFTPYRVCPIGAHSDHQFGKITGFAINKGIHMAYGPKKNGIVELTSLQFNKRAQFAGWTMRVWNMAEKPSEPKSNWCCPPFYYYTKEDAKLVEKGIL